MLPAIVLHKLRSDIQKGKSGDEGKRRVIRGKPEKTGLEKKLCRNELHFKYNCYS